MSRESLYIQIAKMFGSLELQNAIETYRNRLHPGLQVMLQMNFKNVIETKIADAMTTKLKMMSTW